MADVSLNESDEVTIAGSDGINKLIVNSDGSINAPDYPFFLVMNERYFGINIESNIATAGEQDVLLIRNPAGSGRNLYLNRIFCGVLGTATRFRVRVYQKPTVTSAGTSAGIFSNMIKGSPVATVMTAYTNPTISARGTRMRTYTSEGTNSIDDSFDFGLDVNPGYDILITGDFDTKNKVLALSLQWGEMV
jgi:hypothetical protein